MTDQRVAFITGAAAGIGAATAIELARRGHWLVLVDRDADGLAVTAAAIRDTGGEARIFEADVTDRAAASGSGYSDNLLRQPARRQSGFCFLCCRSGWPVNPRFRRRCRGHGAKGRGSHGSPVRS